MQEIQEAVHGATFTYDAPHLKHDGLVRMLSAQLFDVIGVVNRKEMPLTLLEVGAGHGGYTKLALAAGCSVTATEMSRASITELDGLFGTNPMLNAVFDESGELTAIGSAQFSIVLCSSVLHHIPDYTAFLTGPVFDHLAPGGTVLCFQDPLWYPRLSPIVHWADRWAYLLYRLPRGNYRRGLAALWRRLTHKLDESQPSDMSEYHVMRSGVDEVAITSALTEVFDRVEVVAYWSTPARSLQWLGERAGLRNTFALRASGFRGHSAEVTDPPATTPE